MARLFGRMERRTSLENPSIPISSDSIITLLGTGITTDAGIHVSEFNAMRLGAMWRCVSIISGIVAGLPLRVYSGNRDDIGPKTPTNTGILSRPPEGMTMYEFKEQIMVHLLLWGNSYVRKVPNQGGNKTAALVLYRPWEVKPSRNGGPGTPKHYDVLNGDKNLTDDDIIHIPGLAYDGIQGLSPIQYARNTIGTAVAVEQYGAKFFGNGAMLSGLIKSNDKIPQDKAEQIKQRWRDKFTGLARAHEVAVLDSGLEYVPLAVPPETAQFLATRLFNVNEIARWFGVPPHLIGDVDRTTSWGQGIAEQTLGFVRFTIGFWASRVEERLSQALPSTPAQYAEFDLDNLLRADANQRASFYHQAISDGWLNRAEVRIMEGRTPAPDEAGLEQFETSMTEQIATKVNALADSVNDLKQQVSPTSQPQTPGAQQTQPEGQDDLSKVQAQAASGKSSPKKPAAKASPPK